MPDAVARGPAAPELRGEGAELARGHERKCLEPSAVAAADGKTKAGMAHSACG